jgi:hypothetical protein
MGVLRGTLAGEPPAVWGRELKDSGNVGFGLFVHNLPRQVSLKIKI